MQKREIIYLSIILTLSFVIFLTYLILVPSKNQAILTIDESVANYFYNHRSRILDYILVGISYLGETFALMGFCALLLLMPNRKTIGIPVTIITISAIAINFVIKILVMRERPMGLFLTEPTLFYNMPGGHSFPSGHSQQAVVFFVSLSILLSQQTKKLWHQMLLISGATILAALSCFARVYLCVHFLSDVQCGLSIAICLLTVGMLINNHSGPRLKPYLMNKY